MGMKLDLSVTTNLQAKQPDRWSSGSTYLSNSLHAFASPMIASHSLAMEHNSYDEASDLAAELRQAMRDPSSRLTLHYQPLVSADDGSLEGFEALLRWTTVANVYIDPPKIIELVNNYDMAEALDLWVLQHAVLSAAQWVKAKPDIIVAVNMTAALLSSPECFAIVGGLLHTHTVPARNLSIEVTEELTLNEEIRTNLRKLRQLGIRLAIDDFGTGMSTLARLMDLAVDTIKLDRSFILGRTLTSKDEEFLAALVRIGTARGASVTIEGVSRAEDVALARRIGCNTCQGFWFGRAVNRARADAIVMTTDLQWHENVQGHA
jgi:EAL domain-containing protein (putative c-di-GMP-specific phosphodiesterase class I)